MPRLGHVALGAPRWRPYSLPVRDALPNRSCETSEHRTRVKVPNCAGRCYKTFGLLTGPCQALGADTPRDAELRGDLACSRLGSERKYVKRIYARDTGKARRQFAR